MLQVDVDLHLGQKHKKIGPDVLGGRKVINPISDIFALALNTSNWRCQSSRHLDFHFANCLSAFTILGTGGDMAVNKQT